MLTRIRLFSALLLIAFGGMSALSEILEMTAAFTIIPLSLLCNALTGQPCDGMAAESFRFPFGVPLAFIAFAFQVVALFLFPWRGLLPERFAGHRTATGFWSMRLWMLAGSVFALLGFAVCQWQFRSWSSYFVLSWAPAILCFLLTLPGIDTGSWRRTLRQVFTGENLLRPLLSLLFVALALTLSTGLYWRALNRQASMEGQSIPELYRGWKEGKSAAIPIPPGAIELGLLPSEIRPDAPVLHVVEFFDFECQPCLESLKAVVPLPTDLRRRIRYSLIHFPLSSECNPSVGARLHPDACALSLTSLSLTNRAEALEMLRRRVKYPAENPKALLPRISEIRHLDALARHVEIGRTLGIRATPSLFVNGKPLPRLKDGDRLPALLRHIEQRETPDAPVGRIPGLARGLNRLPLAVFGNPDSAIEIVEIGAYDCPFSKAMGHALNELMERRSIALIHKSGPLKSDGGFEFVSRFWIALNHLALSRPDPDERRQYAQAAAFFRDWQYRLAGRDVTAIQKAVSAKALERGLDVALLKATYAAGTNQVLYNLNLADLQKNQFSRTPTVYINGILYRGESTVQALEAFIDRGAGR
jgi:protein-disulfide isomerase